MTTITEVIEAHELLENYHKCKEEIKKVSYLNTVTLFFTGERTQATLRSAEDIKAIRTHFIRSWEQRASSILTQLTVQGIDVKDERGYLQTLASQAITGPVS